MNDVFQIGGEERASAYLVLFKLLQSKAPNRTSTTIEMEILGRQFYEHDRIMTDSLRGFGRSQ